MRRILLSSICISAALCSPAFADKVQNMEIIFLAGRALGVSQTVPGTSVRASGSSGFSNQFNYGYQFFRCSAGDLWLEIAQTFSFRDDSFSSTDNTIRQSMMLFTPGIRFQRSLSNRFSLYGAAGGGYGSFNYYRPSTTSASGVASWPTSHGVFDVAGGVDLRLNYMLSLRGEVRDFITGKGLGGASGRQHVLYLFGVALHF